MGCEVEGCCSAALLGGRETGMAAGGPWEDGPAALAMRAVHEMSSGLNSGAADAAGALTGSEDGCPGPCFQHHMLS